MTRPPACRFTVFTATYNRAHSLHRVYDSLVAQTLCDFEWLVVDDGSTDGTADLVRAWQATAPFPIRYYYQANQGQHMACNRGLTLARGEFFAMVDSDDACVPHALARFAELWESIPACERHHYFGVGGLCHDEHGQLVGSPLPCDPLDADVLSLTYRLRVRGQKWWCSRTEVLRHYPWEETPYKAPNPWFAVSRRYRLRLTNECLKIFYQDNPEESLSRAKGKLRPRPVLHRCHELLTLYLDALLHDRAASLQTAMHYVRCSLHLGRSLAEQWRRLPAPAARLYWLLALAPGGALYLRDRWRLQVIT